MALQKLRSGILPDGFEKRWPSQAALIEQMLQSKPSERSGWDSSMTVLDEKIERYSAAAETTSVMIALSRHWTSLNRTTHCVTGQQHDSFSRAPSYHHA